MGILKSWKFRQVGVKFGESIDLRGLGGIFSDSLMDFTWGSDNWQYKFEGNIWKFRWSKYCVRAGARENNLNKIIIYPIFFIFLLFSSTLMTILKKKLKKSWNLKIFVICEKQCASVIEFVGASAERNSQSKLAISSSETVQSMKTWWIIGLVRMKR
jgi:hypothetical protein